MAMIAARIVDPDSKLATTRWWKNTTLPEVFNVTGAGELYAAMLLKNPLEIAGFFIYCPL